MKKLVKCMVCNEIFEEGVDRCPVCGVGPENFVEVEVQSTVFNNNTNQTYVVLGGGIAALSAAEAIRPRDMTGTILMVSNEEVLPYNRPMLTKMLLESANASSILVHDEAWYSEKNIITLLGKQVDSIDPEKKKVYLSDGTWLKYDKCIYALGAECFVPDYEGKDLEGVITIRKTGDARKIRDLLPGSKTAAVIGAGVLGLEAAWELKKAGLDVTVIGHSNQIMGKQLDRGGSDFMKSLIREAGVNLCLGNSIEGLVGENGRVSGVRLADGSVVSADILVISTGVRSNVAAAKNAGLQVARAIVTDAHMRTSVPDIFACGDCAEFEGVNISIWSEASEQGKVAGANAAGESCFYGGIDACVSFVGMGTELYSIGDLGKDPEKEYRVVSTQNLEQKKYKKYWYVNDSLVGAILIGDVDDRAAVTEAVKNR